jgi:hypothetical protein
MIILQRWRAADLTGSGKVPEQGWFTALPLNEELACYLAALYGRKLADAFTPADNDNITRRCAYYAGSELDPNDFEKFYGRDLTVFVMAALLNDKLLCNWRTREPFQRYISATMDAKLALTRSGPA